MPSTLQSQQLPQCSVRAGMWLVYNYGSDSPYLPTGSLTANETCFLQSFFLSFLFNLDSFKPPLNLILWQEQVPLQTHSIFSKSTLSARKANNRNSSLKPKQMVNKGKPLSRRACWALHSDYHLEPYFIHKLMSLFSPHLWRMPVAHFQRQENAPTYFIIYWLLITCPWLPAFMSSLSKHLLNTEHMLRARPELLLP